jgi:superfamily I DNA/RNA helicase
MLEVITPNSEQQACIDVDEGNVVVVAGPGSGKSTVLIKRHLALLSKGIMEKDVLNLTFTASAALNMVEKVTSGFVSSEKVFRTFHSYALNLLQRERAFMAFPMTDEIIPCGQDFLLLRDLINTYPAIADFRALKGKISEWKCSNVDPEQAMAEEYNSGPMFFYACAYADYEKKCREQGWLDFDSLMKEAVKLLETNDDVRLRNQRKYLAIDECQDTDVVQFKLVKLIYGGNIFAVGDENQLIYEWRSAQPGNLSNFSKTFPGARTLFLGQNYRSTRALVDFFKEILPVDNGIGSHMMSEREEGIEPTIVKYADDYYEANLTLGKITDIANTAVIARTNRQLFNFQKRCMGLNVRSRIVGRKNLWEQNEVKALLKLAKESGRQANAAEALTQLMMQHNLAYIYRNSGSLTEKDPVENLNGIIKMAKPGESLPDFLGRINRITHIKKTDQSPILALTTVHQAKGREWKHVFIIGCNQGMMPHKDGEFVEEKRIFFVACSRAADTLEISYFKEPSEFLTQFLGEVEDGEESNEPNTETGA